MGYNMDITKVVLHVLLIFVGFNISIGILISIFIFIVRIIKHDNAGAIRVLLICISLILGGGIIGYPLLNSYDKYYTILHSLLSIIRENILVDGILIVLLFIVALLRKKLYGERNEY